MDEVERRAGPAVDRGVAGLSAVGIGLAATIVFGPVAGPLVAAAASPLVEELSHAVREIAAKKIRQVEAAGREAEAFSGQDLGSMILRSLNDEDGAALLTAALQGAAEVANEQMARALGRAYARGAMQSEDATVDGQLRIVTTIAALQPIDVRVLDAMLAQDAWVTRPLGGQEHASSIVEAVSGITPIVDSVVARLSTHGLITDSSEGGMSFGSRWRVTEYGRLCLVALTELGDASPTEA